MAPKNKIRISKEFQQGEKIQDQYVKNRLYIQNEQSENKIKKTISFNIVP